MSTVATLNSLMGEKFRKTVKQTFHSDRILMMMFNKLTPDEINERGGRLPIRTRRMGSFSGGTENQDMPVPVDGEYRHWTPDLRAIYSSAQFSGFAHWQQDVNTVNGKKNKLKLANMLGQEVYDNTQDFKYFCDDACFKDGNGKLSDAITAITTGANGTFTVDPATANFTVDEIPRGARINFYSNAGAIRSTGATVSIVQEVNETTGVVTCDNIPTDAVVTDFPVWEGSWGLMPAGLKGNIQDQNITFQGIDVTNYPQLKANVHDAAGASFDIRFVNRLQTRSKKRTGVQRPTNDFWVLTHPKQVDAYRNAGYAINTIISDQNRASKKLDLAYTKTEISGMSIYESNSCGERDLYGLRRSSFRRYELFAPNLLPLGDGESQYLVPVPGTNTYKHQYQYYFAFYGNIICEAPAENFLIQNLDKTNLG